MNPLSENQHTILSFRSLETWALLFFSALIGGMTYHPFYFGDEMFVWYLNDKYNGSFAEMLSVLSNYKPRIVFNSLWALISTYELPRMALAAIVVLAESAVIFMIIKIVSLFRKIENQEQILIAIAYFTCRFSITFWFDYMAGSIETLSLLFFLIGIFYLCKINRKLHLITVVLAFTATCLIHERFMAGIFMVGLWIFIFEKNRTQNFAHIASLVFIPIITFVIAGIYFSAALDTGTAGRKIELNIDVIVAFLSYISNVLFNTNFGFDWFVGDLNWGNKYGKVVSVLLAILTVITCMYIYTKRQVHLTHGKYVVLFGLIGLALIAVASLPGLQRQEARWMYPVYCMILILAGLTLRSLGLKVFLTLLIISNSIYLFSGSTNSIANIVASRLASSIGYSIAILNLGSRGAILGESSAGWVLAGNQLDGNLANNGKYFSHANEIVGTQIDPIYEITNDYDFVLFSTGRNSRLLPTFDVVNVETAKLLSQKNPTVSNIKNRVELNDSGTWKGWTNRGLKIKDSKLILSIGADAFLSIPAEKLDQNLLVYAAHSVTDEKQLMRLQVNWHDKANAFIASSIKVVDVGPATENFLARFNAPKNATQALIYATLHDASTDGSVALENVFLINTSSFE